MDKIERSEHSHNAPTRDNTSWPTAIFLMLARRCRYFLVSSFLSCVNDSTRTKTPKIQALRLDIDWPTATFPDACSTMSILPRCKLSIVWYCQQPDENFNILDFILSKDLGLSTNPARDHQASCSHICSLRSSRHSPKLTPAACRISADLQHSRYR